MKRNIKIIPVLGVSKDEFIDILASIISYCKVRNILWTEITPSFIKFYLEHIYKLPDEDITRHLINILKDKTIEYLKLFDKSTIGD